MHNTGQGAMLAQVKAGIAILDHLIDACQDTLITITHVTLILINL